MYQPPLPVSPPSPPCDWLSRDPSDEVIGMGRYTAAWQLATLGLAVLGGAVIGLASAFIFYQLIGGDASTGPAAQPPREHRQYRPLEDRIHFDRPSAEAVDEVLYLPNPPTYLL